MIIYNIYKYMKVILNFNFYTLTCLFSIKHFNKCPYKETIQVTDFLQQFVLCIFSFTKYTLFSCLIS